MKTHILTLVHDHVRARLEDVFKHSGSSVKAVTVNCDPDDTFKYEIHVSGTHDCKMRTILGNQENQFELDRRVNNHEPEVSQD